MPQRPPSHVTGDRATNAVVDLIGRAGHAVERILNDYGEDLLVQTAHAGRMDACRLWVQVKGTTAAQRLRLADGSYRVRIPFDQALRWLRTLDTVIVVLWDVSASCGWFAYPWRQLDELTLVGRRHVNLRFDDEQRFHEGAVDSIAWQARLLHYDTIFSLLEHSFEMAEDDKERGEGRERRAAVGLDLLTITGVALSPAPGEYQLTQDAADLFWAHVRKSGYNASEVTGHAISATDVDTREALVKAAMATFVSRLDYDDLLLPLTALTTCADLVLGLAGVKVGAPA